MIARGLDRDVLRTRLIAVLAIMVFASVVAQGFAAIAAFDRAVRPELTNRTQLIGTIVRSEIQRALDLGIPLHAMAGLDEYLSETLAKFDEVDRIVVHTVSGEAIAAVARPSPLSMLQRGELGRVIAFRQSPLAMPIIDGNELVGTIAVEISPLFVQTRLRDVFLDVMVIALVAMLVAMELALAVAVISAGKPFDCVFRLLTEQGQGDFRHRIRAGGVGGLVRAAQRLNDHAEDLAERFAALPAAVRARLATAVDARIAEGRPMLLRLSEMSDIRLGLFLFSAATEVAAAFLPLQARAAARPEWLSSEWAAAAPLVFYLLAIAVVTPIGGTLVQRYGARRVFLVSVPPAMLALAAMGFSDSLAGIAIWRGVVAVCFATATVACQGYAIRANPDLGSARPFGVFVGVVYGGVFCGSALGGVVAGRLGFEAAFVTGAAIAALAGLVGAVTMRGRAGDAGLIVASEQERPAPRRAFGARFLALLLGIVVPMNAATAIFVWYLTPLVLAASGSGPAEIARVVMLYYLAAVLLAPMAARLCDDRVGPSVLNLCGGVVSAAALLSLTMWSGFWAVTAAVAGLGLGHALMRPALFAFALREVGEQAAALQTLRLTERLGAILGLALSALALGDVGADASICALGYVVLAGVVLYTAAMLAERSRSD